jgi:diguanylate cyclase (GGDEF)-like protein/PAS domain S-box-containing protein
MIKCFLLTQGMEDMRLAHGKLDEMLNLFFEQAPDGIALLLLDKPIQWDDSANKDELLDYIFAHQRVSKANDAMLGLYRAGRKQFLGMQLSNLFAHNIEQGRRIWRELLDTGNLTVTLNIRRLDGLRLRVESHYVGLSDNEGKIIGHICIQREIPVSEQYGQDIEKIKRLLEETSRMGRVGGWDKDLLTGNDYWSEITKEIFEVPSDFVPSMQNAIEFYKAGANREKVIEVVTRAIETGQSYDADLQIITAKGNERWIRTIGYPEFEDGKCVRLFGTVQDISESVNAEKALIASDINFRVFFETLADMAFVSTKKGRILAANSAAEQNLGYQVDQLKRMKMLDLCPPNQRDEAKELFVAMTQGLRDTCLFSLLRKDETLIPSETRSWLGQWDNEECVFFISKNLSAEQETLQQFEQLFNHNPAIMALLTLPDYKFHNVNAAFTKTTGHSLIDVVGKTPREVGLVAEMDKLAQAKQQILKQGNLTDLEAQLRCNDGTILDGIFWGETIQSQGHEYHLVVMINNTERKQAELALRESEQRYSSLFNQTHDAVFILDFEGRHLQANQRAADLLGYSLEEMKNLSVNETSGEREKSLEILSRLKSGEIIRPYERLFRKKDGQSIPVEINLELVRDASGQPLHIQSVVRDITARKQYEAEMKAANEKLHQQLQEIQSLQDDLRQQALRDAQTGLYNRRYLEEIMQQEVDRARRKQKTFSVVIFDLDNLKSINDTYGHIIGGDQAIKSLADALKQMCRPSDTICRYGGDEFLVLLYDTSASVAAKRANQWLREVRKTKLISNGHEFGISFSAGVAEFEMSDANCENTLIRADRALYQAKEMGKNCVVMYSKDLDTVLSQNPK